MNYAESLKKRYKYERKADKVMSIYIKIGDDLYSKHAGKYASVTKIEIDETGINYEYWIDYYDFSKGRGNYFVSKEKLESLVDKYKIKERKLKLKKLANEKN